MSVTGRLMDLFHWVEKKKKKLSLHKKTLKWRDDLLCSSPCLLNLPDTSNMRALCRVSSNKFSKNRSDSSVILELTVVKGDALYIKRAPGFLITYDFAVIRINPWDCFPNQHRQSPHSANLQVQANDAFLIPQEESLVDSDIYGVWRRCIQTEGGGSLG